MTRRREKRNRARVARGNRARGTRADRATRRRSRRRARGIARRRRARERGVQQHPRGARSRAPRASASRRRGDRRARRGRSAKREAAGASGAKGAREPVEEEGWRNGRVVVVRESRESGPGGVLRDHPQTLSRDDPTAGLQRTSLENSSVAPSIFDRETQFTRPTGSTNPHAVPRHRDVTGFDSRNRAMGIQSAPNSRELLTWSPREKAAKLLVSSPGRRRALLCCAVPLATTPAGNGGLADALRGRRKGRFTSRSSRVEARHRTFRVGARERWRGAEHNLTGERCAVCSARTTFPGTRSSTPRSRAGFGARAREDRAANPRASLPDAFFDGTRARSRFSVGALALPRPHPGACPSVFLSSSFVRQATASPSRKPQNARDPARGTRGRRSDAHHAAPPRSRDLRAGVPRRETRRGSKEPRASSIPARVRRPSLAFIQPRAACVPRRKRCRESWHPPRRSENARRRLTDSRDVHRRRSASDADAPGGSPARGHA